MKRISAVTTVLLSSLVFGCIDPYTPPTTSADFRILVVDGFYNSLDTTFIKLTRSQTIQSTTTPIPETDATVTIGEEGGIEHALTFNSKGIYFLPSGIVDNTKNVRIHIRLASGIEYASPYVPVAVTPPIDNVDWKKTLNGSDSGVQILVNSHDPAGKTRYYRWEFDGTWEYVSRFNSRWIRTVSPKTGRDTIVDRVEDLWHCWKTEQSNILIKSTTDLAEDVVSEFPLLFINQLSPRLSIRYSMLVRQYAITPEAYLYWQNIQRNTDDLGTIFGPLPSSVTGNISCLTDSSIPVIGFFSAGSVTTKRFDLYQQELASLNHYADDYQACLNTDEFRSLADQFEPTTYLFLYQVYQGDTQIGWQMGPPICTDCRLTGGTNVKPPFW